MCNEIVKQIDKLYDIYFEECYKRENKYSVEYLNDYYTELSNLVDKQHETLLDIAVEISNNYRFLEYNTDLQFEYDNGYVYHIKNLVFTLGSKVFNDVKTIQQDIIDNFTNIDFVKCVNVYDKRINVNTSIKKIKNNLTIKLYKQYKDDINKRELYNMYIDKYILKLNKWYETSLYADTMKDVEVFDDKICEFEYFEC